MIDSVSKLFIATSTRAFFKQIAQEYFISTTGDLQSFLNDLPLLPSQEWHYFAYRGVSYDLPLRDSSCILSSRSVASYVDVASYHNFPIPPRTSIERCVSILLANIASGVLNPTLLPTTFDGRHLLTPHPILLSTQAMSHLLSISSSKSSPPSNAAISAYLFSLAESNCPLNLTRPDSYTIESSRGLDITVDSSPPEPNRDIPFTLRIPVEYLAEQASRYGLSSPRPSPTANAALVMEYIGLGWLVPEHNPI